MENLPKEEPKIGQTYSAVRNGREEFVGKVVSIRAFGERGNLVKLEDDRKNYMLYWSHEMDFVDPTKAPKKHIPTETERLKEKCEYYSSYKPS